jgi:threonine/homoserine/homoserine lactone efflux protein
MTLETVFIFIMALLLVWIKPGPGQALKITRTLNDGFLAGFYFVLGDITICFLFFLIAVLGANTLTLIFNDASFFLKMLGGTYLLYLGYKGFKNIDKGLWQGRVDKTQKQSFVENYSLGLLVTVANPLTIFFFIGLMPSIVTVGEMTARDIIIGLMCIAGVALVADLLLLTLVHQVKEALSETGFVRKINLIASLGFVLIGLFLLFSAFFLDENSFNVL